MTSSGCSLSISFSSTRAAASGSITPLASHEDRAVGPHGERGAQLLLAVRGPDGGDDDLLGEPALLDAQRLLERDLVEGVDAHLHAVGDHAAAVGLDPDAHVVIDDALDADQDALHAISLGSPDEAGGRRRSIPAAGRRCCRDGSRR